MPDVSTLPSEDSDGAGACACATGTIDEDSRMTAAMVFAFANISRTFMI